MNLKDCYCCSGKAFDVCCKPFIEGTHQAVTAEQLMRSRYSAYVLAAIDYIICTTHPSTRNQYDAASIRAWAESSQWQKLEVLNTKKGTANDLTGKVEFKAYFKDSQNNNYVHHELSDFLKEDGNWFFVKGIVF
ncbi:MAG: YchJ family protein [Cytophaga sp.]|uniref:YchJ family protein n=1 Tax=Cytophaga sp. TaxID=29535 RepID=UPI003F7EEF4D